MKFFIAAPWKNKLTVESLSETLTNKGYEVYSFLKSGANLSTGFSIAEELRMFSAAMRDWDKDPNVKKIFDSEIEGLKNCDAVLLLQPAGSSSLIEAGIGYGLGKKIFAIGPIEKPEVFYLICNGFYPDTTAFLNDVATIAK